MVGCLADGEFATSQRMSVWGPQGLWSFSPADVRRCRIKMADQGELSSHYLNPETWLQSQEEGQEKL